MDPWVFAAWILTIFAAISCVAYGVYYEFLKKPKKKETPKKETEKKEKKTPKETKKEDKPDKKTKKKVKRKKKAKISEDIKQTLKIRKEIKKRTPKFRREEWYRYKRIPKNWRRPDGIHSKMRVNLKYRSNRVRVGFRGPKKTRGLHSSGFELSLIHI